MATPTVYTPKRLASPAQLTTSAATLYTSPAGKAGTQIKEIVLLNTAGTAVTATLYLVPKSGSAATSNMLLNAVDMPTNGLPLIVAFDGLFLNESDFIQGLASTGSQVTFHLSGVELE